MTDHVAPTTTRARRRQGPSTTFQLTPSKSEHPFSVKPAAHGVTLQLAHGAYRLGREQALAIADAIVDACEHYG